MAQKRALFSSGAIVELDVHGVNLYQAKIAVDAALRRSGGAYRIRVIHGYTHGAQIKEMLYADYADHPLVLRLSAGQNPGQTDMVLREL